MNGRERGTLEGIVRMMEEVNGSDDIRGAYIVAYIN